ncbi:MAG: glycosyltransferase, partial [Candidatus Glassbacteria bacterium]
YGRRLAEAGVPVFSMPRSRHYEPGRVLKLARQLRSRRIEIVHSFLETANIYSYLAGLLAARPVQVPSVRSLPTRMPLFERRLHERALKSAALVCANSQAGAAAYADRYGIDRDSFRVVYNGVEAAGRPTEQVRLEARRRFRLRSFNPVIGTVGKDEPEKNLAAFLRLTVRLAEQGGGVCALVAGAGLDESYAARYQIERTSVCQAYLLGRLRQMDDFFAALDVFVLTSLREGLPNVILEAMAACLPVVAYDVGGVSELVAHGRTGLLVEKGDEDGLYEAVRALVGDRELARRLGEAGRQRAVEDFTLADMVKRTRQLYAEAVSLSGG